MAETYQRQIGENGAPSAYLRSHATPDAMGAGVANALSNLGGTMDKMSLQRKAFNDRQDEIDAMAAVNDYNRRMNAYLNDPENGALNVRKLKDARGLLSDTETHADELVRDITSRLSEGAAERFGLLESRIREPYVSRSATYEAGQRAEYDKVSADSTLTGFLQSVQADPQNAELIETAIDAGMVIIEQQMPGASHEMKVNASKSWASQLEAAAIEIVLGKDPMLASRMIEGAKYLLPGTRVALEEKIRPEVERVENQGIVEQYLSDYGTSLEGVERVRADIRKNYSGSQRDKVLSELNGRVNEIVGLEYRQDREIAQRQREKGVSYYTNFIAKGIPVPQGQLDRDLQNGDLSIETHRSLSTMNSQFANRKYYTDFAKRNNPNWNQFSADEQDQIVMRLAGTTNEMREEVFARVRAGIMSGEITVENAEASIGAYYTDMVFTAREKADLIAEAGRFGKEQTKFITQQKKEIGNVVRGLSISKANGTFEERLIAQERFDELVSELDSTDPSFRKNVLEAKRQAITELVEASGRELEQASFFGLGSASATPLGGRVSSFENRIEGEITGTDEFQFNFTPSSIDLTPISSSAGEMMLPGAQIQKTGAFTDWRAYRDGQHNGVDYKAPEGTPILSPDIGIPLTVTTARSGSETAGNFVILEGQYPDGRKVTMQVSHMKDGSVTLKNGDTVTAGTAIGQVGSTGVSTGPHMDLKIKIDGEYVDPDVVLPVLQRPTYDTIYDGMFPPKEGASDGTIE